MSKITAAITGVGAYVPDYILSNAELEKMVDTTDEWIISRTGIKERRILKGEGKGTSHMGVEAVCQLLAKTQTDPKDIDLIICATTTPDFVFPATANLIAHEVGATRSFSYDMQAACSGFLYAMVVGAQFIETGKYRKIIVVGADKMSSIIDYQDRATCIIFGDGAGAILLEPNQEGFGVIDSILHSDGGGAIHLHQKAGGSRRPPSLETVQNREHYVYQEGAAVFKHAVVNMAEVSRAVMDRNHLSGDLVDWLVPHQANKRIIDATAQKMELAEEKVMLNIHRYGNTTNGTLPLCLADYESQLRRGQNLIFAAFGGGFTWGAVYVRWAYNGQP
ncbi:MAG: ketoacyl-ACP synthase III [Microscillaceae bacterium]|nr:ketoacyl-ACP synthase III [Microscillaceae bacterium]